MNHFKNKVVVVTGACGTVGRELVNQLVANDAKKIVCLDNNESELYFLRQTFRSDQVEVYIADVRDLEAMKLRLIGADIVLHAAALKHVDLCEDSPLQAIQTNIMGTQNIIDASIHNSCEKVIFTSSDKAVNPTNIMGTSKLMGERLITAAAESHKHVDTLFGSTRFGNVLGSRGSVIPLFKAQIKRGGPITLTDREMTRFIMTLPQASKLVLDSVDLISSGEVFVTKMPVARIEDIAEIMSTHYTDDQEVEIAEIGSKPGEKLYEELMTDEEVRRSYEFGDFFVVLSAFADSQDSVYEKYATCQMPNRAYNSAVEPPMSQKELRSFLVNNRII